MAHNINSNWRAFVSFAYSPPLQIGRVPLGALHEEPLHPSMLLRRQMVVMRMMLVVLPQMLAPVEPIVGRKLAGIAVVVGQTAARPRHQLLGGAVDQTGGRDAAVGLQPAHAVGEEERRAQVADVAFAARQVAELGEVFLLFGWRG